MGKYESPKYELIMNNANFELRKYAPFYTTSVIEKNLKGYSGFGLLFGYISGENEKREKMNMTVPVINQFDKDQITMEFVIPSSVALSEIPDPINSNIKIKHYPEMTCAVICFSGNTGPSRVEQMKNQLSDWIELMHFEIIGNYRLARYNPPFSLPFLRKNEILVEVKA